MGYKAPIGLRNFDSTDAIYGGSPHIVHWETIYLETGMTKQVPDLRLRSKSLVNNSG